MSSEPVIRVRDVGKAYAMYARPHHRLLELLFGARNGRWRRDHHALKGVSFDVRRGETVGIVGRNGSGKSTLLQILCGTLSPSDGEVSVSGRVAALLELGAGFNPEFTGRENVFLNGTVLGLTREEVAVRFDAITAFADIGAFIDEPVRTYSSGMYVRLAFAVAIHVEPDVLIVDEALSVGDEAFQRKCFGRIEQLRERGATILFVSHSAGTVIEICDRALLVDAGEVISDGRPRDVVALYQKLVHAPPQRAAAIREAIIAGVDATGPALPLVANGGGAPSEDWDPELAAPPSVEYERRGARIDNARIEDPVGRRVNILRHGADYVLRYRVVAERPLVGVRFGMMLRTVTGVDVCGVVSASSADAIPVIAPGESIDAVIRFRSLLAPGTYFVSMGVLGRDGDAEAFIDRRVDALALRVAPVPGWLGTGLVDLHVVVEPPSVRGATP